MQCEGECKRWYHFTCCMYPDPAQLPQEWSLEKQRFLCPVCRKKTTVKYVKGLCVSIFIQDMAAPHLKERRRLDVVLKKELERKRAAEDQQRAEVHVHRY